MKFKRLSLVCIAAWFVIAHAARGDVLEAISIPRSIPLALPENQSDKVRSTCPNLPEKFAQYIADVLGKKAFARVTFVDAVSDSTPGKSLAISITSVFAKGGGGWSGPKIMNIHIQLLQDGRLVSQTERYQWSRGTPFQDSCGLLNNDAKALSRAIYAWMVEVVGSDTLPAQMKPRFGTNGGENAEATDSNH